MAEKKGSELARNRRAYHDYEILETYEAGIALVGTEVKSLRDGGGHLAESYVRVVRDELWLIGASIAPYKMGNIFNHDERRDRKLLMRRREIDRLKAAVQEKGLTLVPLALYLKRGKIKLRFGKARGKKHVDKRAVIKERDVKRRMDQMIRHRTR